MRLACVTGRFQPVHAQHLELFELALRDAEHLVVAVTNPDPGARHQEPTSAHRHSGAANPFSYYQRARLLRAALAAYGLAERCTIVPFDLTRAEHWPCYVPLHAVQFVRAYSDWERHKAGLFADAGYPVRLLDGDPATRVSASNIRAAIADGPSWTEQVLPAIVPLLREFLAARESST